MRNLIVLLAIVAGILACAIYVVASSRTESALAEAKSQAEEARIDAAQRAETLERENADLEKQLEGAKANLDRLAEKLLAAGRDASRLRGDLDAALKQGELGRKDAEARIRKAEDLAADARDAEQRAALEIRALKKDMAALAAKAPQKNEVAHVVAKKHGHKNGKNNNVAAKKNRGPVAAIPRTSPTFSELDTNHDGQLSLDEYKVGFPDVADVEKEFKALDTNGDGELSIDEYKAGHPDPPVVRTKKPTKN